MEFEKYLENLSKHEDEKNSRNIDARTRILINAGISLNWIGDYLANPAIKFRMLNVPVQNILFTGTSPKWDEILLGRCNASVRKFQELVEKNNDIKEKFLTEASFGDEPLLLLGPNVHKYYWVFDGMHRLVGAALKNKTVVKAFVPVNEQQHLPICEAHVIYDLIRGFQRHAKDEEGKQDLFHALRLLSRTYGNVRELLKERFNFYYIPDKEVQIIIENVLKQS